MFFAIGLLYLVFTLLIEYFLWLKPVARTILFSLFVIVETALLLFYILIPVFKIWGLKKGINEFEASKIIGSSAINVRRRSTGMYPAIKPVRVVAVKLFSSTQLFTADSMLPMRPVYS